MRKSFLIMLTLTGTFFLLNSCNNFNPPNNAGEYIQPPSEETEIPDGMDASSNNTGEDIQSPSEETEIPDDMDVSSNNTGEDIQSPSEETEIPDGMDVSSDNTGENIQSPSDENEFSSSTDVPLLTTESYQAYQDFIKANTLPDHFVYYDHIKQFGAFDHFVCLSEARYGDYSHYMYSLIGDNGSSVVLYVKLGKQKLSETNIITDINKKDMRVLPSKESGIYEQDGLRYSYVNGKLLSISWQSKELTYTLSGDPMLNNYPVKSTTLVGKMMNLQTASSMINSLFPLDVEK